MRLNLPGRLKVWTLPLIGIPALLVWASWGGDAVRFMLFTHHLFWIAAFILLYLPVTETLWPSSTSQQRAQARQGEVDQKSTSPAESPAERLARLRQEKESVDRKLENLSSQDKEQIK